MTLPELGLSDLQICAFALCRAVALNAGRTLLEVWGGVDLQTIREIATTGVDRISIGKLTKDVLAVALSLRVIGERNTG